MPKEKPEKITDENKPLIKADYLAGLSIVKIVKKYKISRNSLSYIMKNEKWADEREEIKQNQSKLVQKIFIEKIEDSIKIQGEILSEAILDRSERLASLNQMLCNEIGHLQYKISKRKKGSKVNYISDIYKAAMTDERISNQIFKFHSMVDWINHRDNLKDVKSLYDMIDKFSTTMIPASIDPESTLRQFTEMLYKKEHVESMKTNRVPYKALEKMSSVAVELIRKFIPTEDRERFEKAAMFLKEGQEEVRQLID